MNVLQRISRHLAAFGADERGEVTIAWVAITAAIIGMSITVLMQIGDGTTELSGNVGNEMASQEIQTTF